MFDMRRRQFTSLLCAAAAWPLAVHAQQPAVKIPRGVTQIGVLWPVDDDQVLAAFRQALRELGYIEGQNIAYEYRSSRGDDALLPALASELVRLDVDLILTWGVTAGRIANCALIGQKNWISGARHALKLVDGSLGNVPVRPDNGQGGFTVGSENPVYIYGDYNSSAADPTWGNPAAWHSQRMGKIAQNSWHVSFRMHDPFEFRCK